MKVELHLPSGPVVRVSAEGSFSRAACACPSCGHELLVVGKRRRVVDDRYHASDAYCVRCHAEVGEVRAYPDTLFGIAEDAAVLSHGRARVYGGGLRA